MYVGKINKKRHFGFIEILPGIWYEEATGLPWSTKRSLGRGKGWATDGKLKLLTCKNSHGYYYIRINGKLKSWHRVIYEYFNGRIPAGLQVDHMNNVRTDNRISNLQLLSAPYNCRFCLKQKNNTSGFPGVTWDKARKKWKAKIYIDCKNKHLGYFDSPEVAYEAYLQGKIKFHGKESIRSLCIT